jgi:RND family efflux transporter MFP subunit
MTTATAKKNLEPAAPPAGDRSPRATSVWWKLAAWGVFLTAVALGVGFGGPIQGWLVSLVPPPPPRGEVRYWVSPHDPSYRSDRPGKDSMGMDLLPVYAGEEAPAPPATVSPVLQERDYATIAVERGPLVRTFGTVGTIAYAEPLIGDVTLKMDAWLEKLHVNYEGQPVRKGEPLFEVYSPDLVSAEEQLVVSLQALDAARRQNPGGLNKEENENVEGVQARLRYWDLTEEQIQELTRTRKVRKNLTFYSPFSGIVTQKQAFEGKYVAAGQLLYRIADLSKVWVYAHVYQDQIHCVYESQKVTLTLPNAPDGPVRGKVVYVYPYLEPRARTVKVRVEFENPGLRLKPDMFVNLAFEPHRMGQGLRIPRSAVLDTGLRQLVYLSLPGNRFEAREVKTGRLLDDARVEVLGGLREGEQIVTRPQFLMDSESRLRLFDRKLEPLPAMPGMKPPGHGGHGMQGGVMDRHGGHQHPEHKRP